MFLRRKTKKARGVGSSYRHLCETVRTTRGPRQRVVASLGKLDPAEVAGLSGGWEDLPALLRGEVPVPQPATAGFPELKAGPGVGRHPPATSGERAAPAAASPVPPAQWAQLDVLGLRVERTRDFGESYLGLALRHRLKLDGLLARLLPAGRESVGWSQVARS